MREGLEPSGWNCIYANDIDSKKKEAYEARFGVSSHFHLGDVGDTRQVVERIVGTPFLATASFPCIDLSLAGHYRSGLEGEHSSAFFGFTKVIDSLGDRKPRVVMLENVVGFLTSRGGDDFARATAMLADLGYWLDAFVLDACRFTPQSRPRVFVFGVAPELKPTQKAQSGYLWPVDRTHPLRPDTVMRFKREHELATGWMALEIPYPPELNQKLADVIDVDDSQQWWNERETKHHYEMMSHAHKKQVDMIIASGERWVGTIFRRVRQKTMRAEVRFDGLAGCLRTPKGGSAKQIVIAIDRGELRMRWMSPREYARLQGAPEFPLVGTTSQQLWGFADAVCVPAIKWIDSHVLTPLYNSASIAAQKGVASSSRA